VAIPNIQPGRVESDPMGIPVAASMRPQQDDRFDRLLRDSVANEPSDIEAEVPDSVDAAPLDDQIENDVEDLERSVEADEPSAATETTEADEADAAPLDEQADVTESIRRGEPEQQNKTAGKGTDSPRTSPQQSEPLIAAAFHAQHGTQQSLLANAQGQAQNGVAATRAVEPAVRGSGTAQFANSTPPKAASVQTGYATKSAHSMQMLDQARDSVFKQIMMKLNDDGGEMRMRLQPPELGQLDLRMTVEGGNKLTLLIAAERSDMAQLLQRHIEELKTTLAENGLEVTGAEVQTRDDFERQQAANDAGDGAATGQQDDFAEDAASAPQQRGYITAEGLDFWA